MNMWFGGKQREVFKIHIARCPCKHACSQIQTKKAKLMPNAFYYLNVSIEFGLVYDFYLSLIILVHFCIILIFFICVSLKKEIDKRIHY